MDWTTILTASIPAIVTGAISYIVTRFQCKSDLKKAEQENKAEIERLLKQHEINIEALREQHKMEMETKDKEHEHKLQIMQKEHELIIAKNKTEKNDDAVNNVAGSFMQSFMQNPRAGMETLSALKELEKKLKNKK